MRPIVCDFIMGYDKQERCYFLLSGICTFLLSHLLTINPSHVTLLTIIYKHVNKYFEYHTQSSTNYEPILMGISLFDSA